MATNLDWHSMLSSCSHQPVKSNDLKALQTRSEACSRAKPNVYEN